MEKLKMKAIILSVVVALNSGCSSDLKTDIDDLPIAPFVGYSELMDFYSNSLEYEKISAHTFKENKLNYEMQEVNDKNRDELLGKLSKVEEYLSKSVYEESVDSRKILTPEMFDSIKAMLDDKVVEIGDNDGVYVGQSLGYYFIEKEYKYDINTNVKFNTMINYLGMHGSFVRIHNDKGDVLADVAYMPYIQTAIQELNGYYFRNNIYKVVKFDIESMDVRVVEVDKLDDIINEMVEQLKKFENMLYSVYRDKNRSSSNNSNNSGDGGFVIEESEYVDMVSDAIEGNISEEMSKLLAKYGGIDIVKDMFTYQIIPKETDIRFPKIDTRTINSEIGGTLSFMAYVPDISMLINNIIENGKDKISGYGIQLSGNGALRDFGYEKEKGSGTIKIRYVYEDDIKTRDKVIRGVYLLEYDNNNAAVNQAPLVPTFLLKDLEVTIEKMDRALINNDTAALMRGSICNDVGYAIHNGLLCDSTYILMRRSILKSVLSRQGNRYLVEYETITREGAKGTEMISEYREESYAVIEQIGTEYVIIDSVSYKKSIIEEPALSRLDSVTQRTVALGLSGEIDDSSKVEIKQLMSDWWNSSTDRKFSGPYTYTSDNGEEVEVKRGMYDCFEVDRALLSDSKFDYYINSVLERSVKYGSSVRKTIYGQVIEWLSGDEKQAEITTEEIMKYSNGEINRITVYYVVSKISLDEWSIQEMNILTDEDITDEYEKQLILERFSLL